MVSSTPRLLYPRETASSVHGYTDPRIPDLGTTWGWVVGSMPRLLYPRETASIVHGFTYPRIPDLGTTWMWVVSFTGLFTPRERAPGTHWIRGWVGTRSGLDCVEKRKISPLQELELPTSPPSSALPDYADCTVQVRYLLESIVGC
jgi:hypothetical protein